MSEPIDDLALAILGSFTPPPTPLATATIVSITPGIAGNVVVVSGLADQNVTVRSTGILDLQYSTAGNALVGLTVIIATISGQPCALTTV